MGSGYVGEMSADRHFMIFRHPTMAPIILSTGSELTMGHAWNQVFRRGVDPQQFLAAWSEMGMS